MNHHESRTTTRTVDLVGGSAAEMMDHSNHVDSGSPSKNPHAVWKNQIAFEIAKGIGFFSFGATFTLVLLTKMCQAPIATETITWIVVLAMAIQSLVVSVGMFVKSNV